jgi:serine/threonine protein kinase/tetratricopeptide (TPR) repeat protein
VSDSHPPSVKAGRFTIRRRLASGGFGDVYEAFDQARLEPVALKVLRVTDAGALYRFKQEFRTLANLAHPNLVTLHELIASDEEWLLSMELIRGGTVVDYVRSGRGAEPGTPSTDPLADASTIASSRTSRPQSPAAARRLALPIDTLDFDRLRASLRQLVEAVQALHAHGILHLDIKPSNVLVTEDGRVVVVDFGLAERFDLRERNAHGAQIIGTPEYMSPEQAAAAPPSEASDWYGVGAVLYRALTGLNTFPGDSSQVLLKKLDQEPIPAGELVPGLPADLERLCRDLLRRDPSARPSAAEILVRLDATVRPVSSQDPSSRPHASTFVGRSAQLAALDAAFAEMAAGRPAAAHAIGKSGMGKSALVRAFIDRVKAGSTNALVLEGRCYEHEALPFKAFDGLLDALSTHLRGMRERDVLPLLPMGVAVLSRVFPALGRVPAIAGAHERTRIADPTELRRRAFASLREFFARVAERWPLVLVIDDLQWGDLDSATLLDELLRPPNAPPLLLVICYRSDEQDSPCLRALLSSELARGDEARAPRIEVAELGRDEAEALVRSLLPGGAASDRAGRIAHDTQGNPFLIDQLARLGRGASEENSEENSDEDSLESVIWNRMRSLPDRSRRFMEVVAIAGQPIEIAIAAAAAELDAGAFDLFASLRAQRLLRSRSRQGATEAEPYHDRIREMIVARLPADRRASHHRRVAEALELAQTPDLESLMHHYRAGGEMVKAAAFAVAAARQSEDALAFAGAARLYRLAIELSQADADLPGLYVKLAEALSMIGRASESATAFLAAAERATPLERVELQRRAGEQYLQGFHLEQGLALLRASLSDVGVPLAKSTTSAFLQLVVRRLYQRWRGISFHERAAADIPAVELQRLDLIAALCRGLGFTDSLRAVELQSRHLALALKVGEPSRVARALTMSATADGLSERRRERAFTYLQQAIELSERVRNPFGVGIVHSSRGLLGMGAGRWLEARREFDTALTVFRERCIAPPYTAMLCRVYRLEAVFCAGQLREYFNMVPEFVAECHGCGDLHAEVNAYLRQSHLKCFVDDDVRAAWDELNKARDLMGDHKLLLTKNYYLFRRVEIALYEGDYARAWSLMRSERRSLLAMRVFGFQALATMGFERRAYAALGMAAAAITAGQDPRRFLAVAEKDARSVEAWRLPFGRPIAELIRGTVALQRGDRQRADQHLGAAEEGFTAQDMALHAAVARWRRGAALGGEAGERAIEAARAWMADQGVRNPKRMSQIIAPI